MTSTSDLPASWVKACLGDVTSKPQYGWTTKASRSGNSLRLLRTSDISSGRVSWAAVPRCEVEPKDPEKYFLNVGDIVVARAGSVGKSFLMKEDVRDAVFASYLVRFAPRISSDYVYFFMQSRRYWEQIEEKSVGIAIPNVNASKLSAIKLPLPPLAEQERIVERIETLFAELDKGEESLRQVQTLLARYRQSVLKAAVTTEIDGSAEKVRLGELLEDIRYGTAKKCRTEVEGVAVLRIPNVVSGQIDLEDLKFTELDEKELSRLRLNPGDLLLVRSNGSANLVGRTAVVDDRAAGMAFAGYLIRLRVDRDRLLPEFLHIVLNSPEVRAKIERQARSTSGVHNINSAEVRAIEFDLPELDVQARIVELVGERIGYANEIEIACAAELTRSAALRQSILKDAFSGRLVPQDPNDEPAFELLARIRRSQEAGRAAKR